MTRVLPFIALALLVLVAIIPPPSTAENSRYWLVVFDYPGIARQVEVDNGSIYVAGVRTDTGQGFLVRLNGSGYPERTLFFGSDVDTVAFALDTNYIYLAWTSNYRERIYSLSRFRGLLGTDGGVPRPLRCLNNY